MIEGGETGLELLEESVALLGGSEALLERARGLLELGSALRRANRRTDAREYLKRPRARPPRGESRHSRARAQDELMATGARPRRVALSGLDALTPSERRVAGMAAKELTNRDIAQALFVTPKTVEVHLSSVYRKLGIASRAQLADALGSRGVRAGARPRLGGSVNRTLGSAAPQTSVSILGGRPDATKGLPGAGSAQEI